MIAKPIEVKALEDYSIFVRFDDGTQGAISLKHLAHKGIFMEWDKGGLFSRVHIGSSGAIAWNDDIDICPNHAYLQLRGLTFEQWQQQIHENHAAS